MLQYSPKIVTDSLVMCLDASNNKSYPTDLPVKNGLLVWLDAADDTTFSYSSGTSVSQWRDKSGLNNHSSQATVGSQPSRSTFQNSRKTITFDGTNDFLDGTSALTLANGYTAFTIVKSSATGERDIITSTPAAQSTDIYLYQQASSGKFGNWSNVYTSNSISLNVWYLFSTNVSSVGSETLYLNGSSQASNSRSLTNTRGYRVGAYYTGSSSGEYWSGEIAEILIFNRSLSSTEMKQVHTYLGQKWGISNTDRIAINLAGGFTNPWLLGVGDGATNNMPTYSPYNKTFVFDGTNDIISYPNALGTFGSYTFSFWARRNVESKMALSAYGNASFYWFGDNSWAYTHGGVFGEKYYNKAVSIPLGSYGHYCVTYDGAAVRIYRNGVFEDSQATTGAAVFNVGLQLGKYGSSAGYMFSGDIANFLMYTRALSAAEVQQNYESQKSRFANYIVTSGLVLNLDAGNPYSYAGAGTTWYDVSSIGNNSTLSNGPVYSSDIGGNIVFDGSDDFIDVTLSSLTTTVTLEFWVKYTNLTNNMIFGFALYDIYALSGALGFNTANSDVYGLTSTQVSGLNIAGNWNHIVFVMRSDISYTNNKIYVNGVNQSLSQVLSSEASGNRTFNSGNGRISGWKTDTSYKIPGSIASFRAYNIELSAAQVLQNYNATKGRFGL